jgi:hypothetical protein
VRGKLEDGQLSRAPVTLSDIDKICEAFATVLNGVFHERIEYPVISPEQLSRLTAPPNPPAPQPGPEESPVEAMELKKVSDIAQDAEHAAQEAVNDNETAPDAENEPIASETAMRAEEPAPDTVPAEANATPVQAELPKADDRKAKGKASVLDNGAAEQPATPETAADAVPSGDAQSHED